MPSHSSASIFATAADWAACTSLLRGGSRTFHAASRVLPAAVRRAATGLYAFCRVADDAIDQGADRCEALADLRRRLDGIYAGSPADFAADRAFTDVVRGYAIPKAYPLALLEGFEWDAMNRRYETLAELNAYAVRVAGVVGAMMTLVMDIRDPALIARACDLGVAMQLTNIARDVGEDAACGRLYLPLEWLREAYVDPQAWSVAPCFNEGIAAVVRRLLAAADVLYSRSEAGLARLPTSCRPGMYAARLLYAEIGHELRRRSLDSVNQRTVVPWQRKARLLGESIVCAARRRPSTEMSDVIPEGDFLLASLHAENRDRSAAGADSRGQRAARLGLSDRVVWVVDLFERLERRELREPAIDVAPGLP